MAYNRPRRSVNRPQNLGQNRNVQMRNNARRPGTFGAGPQGPQQQQQCPTGQRPVRDPRTGRMTCGPARAGGGGPAKVGGGGPSGPNVRGNRRY